MNGLNIGTDAQTTRRGGRRPWLRRAAALLAAVLGGSALGQNTGNPFYDVPSGQLSVELKTWADMFWTQRTTGVPAPDAGTFAYSIPEFNSPLFSPAVAASMTVASISASGSCIGQIDEGVIVIVVDPAIESKTQLYMTLGVIETSFDSEPVEVQNHILAIMEALSISDVQVWVENNKLISSGLPVEPVEALPGSPGIYGQPSPETWEHILALGSAAQAAAAELDQTSAPRRALLGLPPLAAEFEEMIVGYPRHVLGSNASTHRLEARFGRYGSLPLLLVNFDDVFVLIDTVNGAVAGPFADESPLDASSLLAAHAAYQSGTPVTYLNMNGCVVAARPRWNPWPPAPPIGPLPHVPTTPRAPSTIPGNPTNWSCTTLGVGPTLRCECTSTEYWIDPTVPPVDPLNVTIRIRTTCTYAGAGCGPGPNPATPNTGAPPPAAAPPANPTTLPAPVLTPTCTTEFEWWS